MFDLQTNVRDIVHVDQSEYKIVLLGDTIMSCRSIHLLPDFQLTISHIKFEINLEDVIMILSCIIFLIIYFEDNVIKIIFVPCNVLGHSNSEQPLVQDVW